MSNKYNIDMRNRSFVANALKILTFRLSAGKATTRDELIRLTLAERPPCYFISYDYASCCLSLLRHGHTFSHPEAAAFWNDLSEKVNKAMNGPRKLNFSQALNYTLCFCRPERYYISIDRARRLLRGIITLRTFAVRS